MQPELPRFQRGRRKLHRAAKFATLVIGITAAAAILSPNSKLGGVSNSASSRRSGRSLLYANETANASTTTTPSATNASCADELESLGFDWSELEELDIKEEEIFAACTFDVVAEFRDIDVETGNISLPWEECDFERDHLPVLFVVVYVLAIIILFVGLAIVCDDFFVPSLEAISERLDLSEDVAGATFMAAGSSAPELFTSIASVGVASDVGVGTIVGSAVFNLLIIIAFTALLAGQVLSLDWRPLARDSFFYSLSIAVFIIVAWDGLVQHYEAAILLALYIVYVVVMKFNKSLMKCLAACRRGKVSPAAQEETANEISEEEEEEEASVSPPEQGVIGRGTVAEIYNHRFTHLNAGELSGSFVRRGSDGPSQRRSSSSLNVISSRRLSLDTRRNQLDVPLSSVLTRSSPNATAAALPTSKQNGHARPPSAPRTPPPTIVQTFVTPPDDDDDDDDDDDNLVTKAESEFGSQVSIPAEKDGEKRDKKNDDDDSMMRPVPCFPPINAHFPSLESATTCRGRTLRGFKCAYKWVAFVVSFPFLCLFTWTVPPCSKPRHRKYYLLSFTMSIVWIFALSFGTVAIAGRVGCLLHVDEYTMGLVVVAIGTSIPDLLSSILVARDGFGDMAISNAIGSNIFDIDLGIGLPYLIRIMIEKGKPILLLTPVELLAYRLGFYDIIPHVKFGIILLLILAVALLVFIAVGFKLNRVIGVVFVFLYGCFLFYAFYQDIHCHKMRTC
ncbi:sodium/potassium/calcium exchanger 3-like isoform X2 [Oscarella lobularis]|uniref:sodium/potassium/calcium exchanger 3-like isoform X2 n=1 Tax=Oscarella lobularis TaxID=121494 RepID=UPI0033133374